MIFGRFLFSTIFMFDTDLLKKLLLMNKNIKTNF